MAFDHSAIPPYPYGPSQWYKQSNFGLYGNQKIRFGNMVSERNEIKTRRYWRPNVQQKRLWSVYLKKFIRLRITTRSLRTVDKCGGLDEYLLGEKPARIKELGMGGWLLRWRIMQTPAYKERLRGVWDSHGLAPPEDLLSSGAAMSPGQNLVARQLVSKETIAQIDAILDEESDEAWVELGEDLVGEMPEYPVKKEGFMAEGSINDGKSVL
jgi:large subunit ribosomal protein L28